MTLGTLGFIMGIIACLMAAYAIRDIKKYRRK